MSVLDKVIALIFPDDNATENQKTLLSNIVDLTESRFMSFLPSSYESVPVPLEYIVVEVSIKRFNRIGSEGMTSESVDSHSITFKSNDFDEYLGEIDRFLDDDNDDYLNDKVIRFL